MRLLWLVALPALVRVVAGEQKFLKVHARPNPDATGHLIFNSVNSLLQQWPNTRYKNGHTIIPASITPGTILYHGRADGNIPDSPEWLGTEPDHSFLICHVGTCQLLTFAVTRELRLVYFDGSSGVRIPTGPLDIQDILFWGKPEAGRNSEDYARISDACAWGKQFGIDGFVRMQMAFEIMFCNFFDGLQLVSNSSIVSTAKPSGGHIPSPPPYVDPKLPAGWKGKPRSFASSCFEVIHAGSWHNYAPGETRVHVDYSGLVSFFDPVFTSLVDARRVQTRDEYRPGNLSAKDTKLAHSLIADVYTRNQTGSGIDWGSITKVVVDRYGERLKLVRHLLEHRGSRNISEQARQVRTQVLIMLTPYMLAEAIPASDSGSRSWIAPIANHCATTVTSWAPADSMTREEWVIKDAIDQILHEICRVISDIWVDAFDVEAASIHQTTQYLTKWKRDVEELMGWLDWSMWNTCSPACGPEELCYIPTWPWVRHGWGWYPGEGDDSDMTPRCISRVEPHDIFLDP